MGTWDSVLPGTVVDREECAPHQLGARKKLFSLCPYWLRAAWLSADRQSF
jgi:hypothetical protein